MYETSSFRDRVYDLVAQIPFGRVMTYGQIAALCGSPRAARIVGGIAHFGPDKLPWHRVVNKQGGLALGFPGGRAEQLRQLHEEGIEFRNEVVMAMEKIIWRPTWSNISD